MPPLTAITIAVHAPRIVLEFGASRLPGVAKWGEKDVQAAPSSRAQGPYAVNPLPHARFQGSAMPRALSLFRATHTTVPRPSSSPFPPGQLLKTWHGLGPPYPHAPGSFPSPSAASSHSSVHTEPHCPTRRPEGKRGSRCPGPGSGSAGPGSAGKEGPRAAGPGLKRVSLLLVPYKWEEWGRPVGRTENCQINDIHTQKGKRPPTHPHRPSPHPRVSLSELPSTGGGAQRSKPQLNSTHPEMLGAGEGGWAASKWTPGVAPPPGQHPPHGMKCSGEDRAQAPPHTHTRTHSRLGHACPHIHTQHACTHPPCATMSQMHGAVQTHTG